MKNQTFKISHLLALLIITLSVILLAIHAPVILLTIAAIITIKAAL